MVPNEVELGLAHLAPVVGERLAPDLPALTHALLWQRALVLVLPQLVSKLVERPCLLFSRLKLDYPRVPSSRTLVRAVSLTRVQLPQNVIDSVSRSLHWVARCVLDRPVVRGGDHLLAWVRVCRGGFAEAHHSVSVQVL